MNGQTQRHPTSPFPRRFLGALTCGILLVSLPALPASAELRAGDRYFVHGLDTDEKNIAAAGNSLYMATIDESVIRLSGTGCAVLNQIADEPSQIIWPQGEDPNYLLPPEEPKEADFAPVEIATP